MKRIFLFSTILLGFLFASFMIYLFWDTDSDVDYVRPSALPANSQKFAFNSHEECRECHPTIYAEWERSWHKMAWTDKWVQGSWGCYRDQDCKSCHLPQPIMANGEIPVLLPRTTDEESGINCLTCHISPQGVLGPNGREMQMTKHCSPIKHDQIESDKNCWQCHPNQYDDWRSSSYYNVKGCKDCHMEEIERPVVPNGPVRKTRVHFWKGAHTYTFLKSAYTFKYENTDEGFAVTIGNPNSGHFFPAERHNRALWVEVFFYDDNGEQIGEMIKWIIREGSNKPRNMKLLDVKPDGILTRSFPYPIDTGYAKATLKFDFFYSQEDEHTRVLEDPKPIPFGKK